MPLPTFLRRLIPNGTNNEPPPRIQEQINPSYNASSPTQEDWYWGRLATGDEEDYYWRRLSDNWYQKDVIPLSSLFLKHIYPVYRNIIILYSAAAIDMKAVVQWKL